MKPMTTLTVTALCALTLWVSPAMAAPECLQFEGIEHCPTGEAQLKLVGNGSRLVAWGLGEEGRDGLASHFEPARHWNAELRVINAQEGQFLRMKAVSEGEVASSVNLQFELTGIAVRPKFVGSDGSYTAEVLSEGKVVARLPGSNGGGLVGVPYPPSQPIPIPALLGGVSFGQTQIGGCFWGFSFDQEMQFVAHDGSLGVGDEIRLVEQVDTSASYPYADSESHQLQSSSLAAVVTREGVSNGFDSIHLQSSSPALVITEEISVSNDS